MTPARAAAASGSSASPAWGAVPRIALGVVVVGLAIIPFRILAHGYFPGDDVLRHAARAVSGRPWSDVLVLRPEVVMDSHPGWHALLGAMHRLTGAGAHEVVLASIVLGYLALVLPAVFLLRRPEAWALALFAFSALEDSLTARFASGRPFLLSMAVVVVLCLLAARPGERARGWSAVGWLAVLLGVVAWMHPSWHLFLLPIGVALLARRPRLAGILLLGLALGVLVAGLLHGNPAQFVHQSLLHTVLAFGSPAPPGTLVREFLPGDGSVPVVLGVLLLLLWRRVRGEWHPGAVDNPVFLLAATGWMLGFVVLRFWSDWGVPALLAWLALELQHVLERHMGPASPRRVVVALLAALGALLVLTANTRGMRWSVADRPYLSLTADVNAPALPDPGGIAYTDDMRLFYDLYYSFPQAPWRYVLGYEPALMPPADLATLRRILVARTPSSFEPWVSKMRPEDRLILQTTEGRPQIPELLWTQVSPRVWSGRRPPAAPGSP